MQDSFAIIFEYDVDPKVDFLGVFDGHDVFGERMSKFLATRLGNFVLSRLVADGYRNIKKIVQEAFVEFDSGMFKLPQLVDDHGWVNGGSTAVCVWIRGNFLIIANTGDSRAVMCVGGKAVPLSFDHKPDNPEEQTRISRAGGVVQGGRVEGVLAVSRSFGDYMFKTNSNLKLADQMVTALPDVRIVQLTEKAEFIIMGSDGLWDCVSNQRVVDMVKEKIQLNMSLEEISYQIMKSCIASPGSMSGIGRDNITVIVAVPVPDIENS